MFTQIEMPPDYQVWADQSYFKVKSHLEDKAIKIFDELQLEWIAAPYFSLWKGKNEKGFVWVLHNDFATQGFEDSRLNQSRQALAYFSYCWQNYSLEEIEKSISLYQAKVDENSQANLASLGRILDSSVQDDELW